MTKVTLELDFTLDAELFEDILDAAGYGIGYWAESGSIELVSDDSEELIYRIKQQDGREFVITRDDMQATICKIVSDNELEVNRVLKNDLTLLCLGDEDPDIDAIAADVLIQLTCFGELVYG